MSRTEDDHRVGAMVRTISGVVRDDQKEALYRIYGVSDVKLAEPYQASCVYYHWWIVTSLTDPKTIEGLISLLQTYYWDKDDCNNDDTWLLLMRLILPTEFMRTIRANFTQIPHLSMLDPTPYKPKNEEGEDDWFV